MARRFRTSLLAIALLAAVSGRAGAGTVPRWELGIGAGALSMPDYRGSDQVRSYVLPFPYVVYRLDWLKIDRSGIRSTLFDREWVDLTVSLSASPPVDSGDNRARSGMDDIEPIVEFGPSLDLHLWRSADRKVRFDVRLPLRAAFTAEWRTKEAGESLSPTANLDVGSLAGSPWQLGLAAGPVFATARQNRYYYGVSDAESIPGRPAYKARGGYSGSQFLVALSRRFGAAWWAGAYARYDTLAGAVFEDSPLVRRDHYASGGIAAAWIFSRSGEQVERED
jgi:outer membrane scaffolding protein for murein synthesis (MipA/OmpV family)